MRVQTFTNFNADEIHWLIGGVKSRTGEATYSARRSPKSHSGQHIAYPREQLDRTLIGLPVYRSDPPSAKKNISCRIEWIDESNRLRNAGMRVKSLDILFDTIDDLLLAGQFGKCDSALKLLTVSQLSNSQIATVLTATFAAKDKLPSRSRFYIEAENWIRSNGGVTERVLAGLK